MILIVKQKVMKEVTRDRKIVCVRMNISLILFP